MAKGGARPGAGRKAGVPNKASNGARELAQKWGPAAIEEAAKMAGLVMQKGAVVGKAESETARMAAINTILDRAYGKSVQAIEGTEDGPAIRAVTEIILRGVRSDARD